MVAAAGLMSLDRLEGARALEAALRVTGQMLSTFERDKGISLVALDMVKVDAKRALAILRKLGPGAGHLRSQVAAELLMRGVAEGKWPGAGELANLADDAVRLQTLLRLAAISIKQDRKRGLFYYRGAAKLANRLASPLARSQLAVAWAGLDSEEAVQRALGIGHAPTRVRALAQVAESLARAGKMAGAEWALIVAGAQLEKLAGDFRGRVGLLCRLGLAWSRLEPEKAQDYFDKVVQAARDIGRKHNPGAGRRGV